MQVTFVPAAAKARAEAQSILRQASMIEDDFVIAFAVEGVGGDQGVKVVLRSRRKLFAVNTVRPKEEKVEVLHARGTNNRLT